MTVRLDPESRVARILIAMTPAINAAIAAELDAAALAPHAARDALDEELMGACRAVGEAVDRLQQAKFTKGEIHARAALERAAARLKGVMKRRRR